MHDIGNAFEIKRHSNLSYTYIRLIYDKTTYLILKTRQLIHIQTFVPKPHGNQQTESNNTLKGSYMMIKWDLPQVHKGFPISANESVWYTTLTSRIKKKTSDHLNKYRKSFLQDSTIIYDKISSESNHRRKLHRHIKCHI